MDCLTFATYSAAQWSSHICEFHAEIQVTGWLLTRPESLSTVRPLARSAPPPPTSFGIPLAARIRQAEAGQGSPTSERTKMSWCGI